MNIKIGTLLLSFAMLSMLCGCGKKYDGLSIEERDYAVTISVADAGDRYDFSVEVADLTEYEISKGGNISKQTFDYRESTLVDVMQQYYEENGRRLDIGHLECIRLSGSTNRYADLIIELGHLPYISKQTYVFTEDGEKIRLRNMIKSVYDGQ